LKDVAAAPPLLIASSEVLEFFKPLDGIQEEERTDSNDLHYAVTFHEIESDRSTLSPAVICEHRHFHLTLSSYSRYPDFSSQESESTRS